MRHPAGGRHSQGAVLVGGGRRCVTRHLLPWRWGRNRAATPCAQRSSSTLAGQDHRRVVPSGLNEPQFPTFPAKRGSATPPALKIGRS
jgi:hypothetical protein